MSSKKIKAQVKVLITGLDNSGKTSILNNLKSRERNTPNPTLPFGADSFIYRETNLSFWNFGGRMPVRHVHQVLLNDMHALIYVVDSNDKSLLQRSAQELGYMARRHRNLPIIVVANKQDLPNALSPEKICDKMGLPQLLKDNPWTIFRLAQFGDQADDNASFDNFRINLLGWFAHQEEHLQERQNDVDQRKNRSNASYKRENAKKGLIERVSIFFFNLFTSI